MKSEHATAPPSSRSFPTMEGQAVLCRTQESNKFEVQCFVGSLVVKNPARG